MAEYWYAIEVDDCEAIVPLLKEQGMQVFYPFMEKTHRKEGCSSLVNVPAFMNCFFLKTSLDISMFKDMLHITYQKIYQLSSVEQLVLSKLMDEAYVIHQSVGFIKDGVTVIEQGPLQGLEAEIKKIDRHKRMAYMRQAVAGMPIRVGLEITTKT